MSTNASLQQIQAVFGAISQPPYCSGTVPLDPAMSTLFYTKNGKAELINFTSPTAAQLAALAETCQQATFGVNNQDVLDESYRKAGKLDAKEFTSQFSPLASGVVETVRENLLRGHDDGEKVICVELYKLNVYGPGSFFKAHVDTPRSETMFGSLVVVLPTVHEGGSLIVRHAGQERVFDTAHAVNSQDTPHASFVAFYSDVEHEVALVTSGYRVTLTYNLYVADSPETLPVPAPLTLNGEPIDHLKNCLSTLLADPTFLPDGGLLGFGLSHKYPFRPSSDNLSQLNKRLKGGDAEVRRVCKALGLTVALKALYTDEKPGDSNPCCLLHRFIDFGDEEIEDRFLYYVKQRYDQALLVYPYETLEACDEFTFQNGDPIVWMKPLTQSNNFQASYIAYGNEATLGHAYGDVCLVAEVSCASERIPE